MRTGLGVLAALSWAAEAKTDSIDRYDPEFAVEYMRKCVEQGTDRRVCACAVDQIANEGEQRSPAPVDAAPPDVEEAAARTTAYDDYVAMCMRSARALGLLGN
jgi:hypothetical protein